MTLWGWWDVQTTLFFIVKWPCGVDRMCKALCFLSRGDPVGLTGCANHCFLSWGDPVGLTGCEHPTANQAVCCFCRQAHLAALEKTSAETEKLIDEAKTEKLRHMEELYQSNRRVAELEAKYAPVSFLLSFVWLFVSFGPAVTKEVEWGSRQGLRKQLLTYCLLLNGTMMETVLVECCVPV